MFFFPQGTPARPTAPLALIRLWPQILLTSMSLMFHCTLNIVWKECS